MKDRYRLIKKGGKFYIEYKGLLGWRNYGDSVYNFESNARKAFSELFKYLEQKKDTSVEILEEFSS